MQGDLTSPPAPLLRGEGSNAEPSPLRRGLGEVNISAKLGIGIEELKKAIIDLVKNQKTSDTVITNLRHYEHLLKAKDALDEVLNGIDFGITGDFLAQDIRLALHHLGEITGTITTDDLLANIFSKFCIGK
jgi:tRNA modification GTPase